LLSFFLAYYFAQLASLNSIPEKSLKPARVRLVRATARTPAWRPIQLQRVEEFASNFFPKRNLADRFPRNLNEIRNFLPEPGWGGPRKEPMFIECRHILPQGVKCKSPALRGKHLCYFHEHLERFEEDGQRCAREPLFLPALEDARGIQMAITQVLAALGSGRVDNRKAGLYLYGLQLATQLAACAPQPAPQEMVCNLAIDAAGKYIAAEEVPLQPPIEAKLEADQQPPIDMHTVEQLIETAVRR
jgi:hypothetical protein